VIRAPRHVAIGIGCVVGAARVAIGAEWSIAPTFSLTFDDDSNRRLATEPQASQSALLYTSWLFQHSTDNTQLSLSPWLSGQFFRGDLYRSDDNANLNGIFDWSTERGRLDTSAGMSDESTLFTELTETGILSSNTRRRAAQGSVSWTFQQQERRSLVLQLSYADSSYSGPEASLLPGYRYPGASIAERFNLSEETTLTGSVFEYELLSRLPGEDTHESGVQLELNRALSERVQLDAAVGVTESSVHGIRNTETLAGLSISRSFTSGSASLGYSRGLTPYGNGRLIQRQQLTLSGAHSFTETVSGDASLQYVQNSGPAALVLSGRTTYDLANVGLNWHSAETWTVRAQLGAERAQLGAESVQGFVSTTTVHDWRASLGLTWTPYPITRSY
jgi:hypothetical protein